MYEKIKDLLRQKNEVNKDYPVSAEQELLEAEAKPKYATGDIVNGLVFVDFGNGRLVPLNTKATPMEEWEPGDNKVMYASTKSQITNTTTDSSSISAIVANQKLKDLLKDQYPQIKLNLGNPEDDERFWVLNRRIEQLEELVKVLEKKVIDLQQAPFVQPYNPIPTPYPYPLYPYPNPWYDPYRPTFTTTGSTDPNVVKYSTTTGGTSIDTGLYKDLDKYYAELLKEGVR